MALTTSFTVSQSALTPSTLTVTDTSTGSDSNVTQRRLYIQDANGNYLVPAGTTTNYIQWVYSSPSITVNVLTQSTAALIRVDWLDVIDVVKYTLANTYALPEYDKQFLYYLVQLVGLQPTTPADTNYSSNVGLYWTNIVAGINAVTYGNDISAGQSAFDRATYMRLHQAQFFN